MKKFLLISLLLCLLGVGGFFCAKFIVDQYLGTPNLANGKEKYITYCIGCHGNKGHGDGPVSVALPIKPDSLLEELTNPWGFKLELIGSVLEGDNGQGGAMPAFKGILTQKDINDIFGYIVDINQK